MENGNKNVYEESAQEESKGEENKSTEGGGLAKVTKAAKMVRQLSKTAMMVSSNTPSIDEETVGNESDEQSKKSPVVADVSKVVQATQLIKRLSEQSMEKSGKEEPGDNAEKAIEDEGGNEENKESENENEEDKDKGDVETASHDAVLGDDAPETENVDEVDDPEETIKDKDPTKVAKAAALVRQLSKQSMTRTESAESRGEAIEGEKPEGRKFKGKWRKSVRDKSRETSLEVQEKIVETPEKEGDIAEYPEAEKEEEKIANENEEVIKPSSEKVITKQPSATVETDGDAIKTIASAEITNPKPKTGFCPCL